MCAETPPGSGAGGVTFYESFLREVNISVGVTVVRVQTKTQECVVMWFENGMPGIFTRQKNECESQTPDEDTSSKI